MAILCKIGIPSSILPPNCFLAVLLHEEHKSSFLCHIVKCLCSKQSLIV